MQQHKRSRTYNIEFGADVWSEFGHWLAGLIDGEGQFSYRLSNNLRNVYPYFSLQLRNEDAVVMDEILDTLKLGHIHKRPQRATGGIIHKPVIVWYVSSYPECAGLVLLLRKFPLHSVKKKNFEIWADAIEHVLYGEPTDSIELHELFKSLRENK